MTKQAIPVCGMDLVKAPLVSTKAMYTCPMHPEIIKKDRILSNLWNGFTNETDRIGG
jgi:hypothetical protein